MHGCIPVVILMLIRLCQLVFCDTMDITAIVDVPLPCLLIHLDGIYSASLWFSPPVRENITCTIHITSPRQNSLVNVSLNGLDMEETVKNCDDSVQLVELERAVAGIRLSLCTNTTFRSQWYIFKAGNWRIEYKKLKASVSRLNIEFNVVSGFYDDPEDNVGTSSTTRTMFDEQPEKHNWTIASNSSSTVITRINNIDFVIILTLSLAYISL